MMEDWVDTGFDPWAEGRDAQVSDFKAVLPGDEAVAEDPDNPFESRANTLQRKLQLEDDAKLEELMEKIMSLTRHGRYTEIEDIVTGPDFNGVHSIDTKDSKGNTLLITAAQNGNKRICKLALRRSADINGQNFLGNTALHYAFSYGFEDLGHYLISKGANDTMTNAEGLTCYEGLSLADVNGI